MAPWMLPQILRACLDANYVELFDELVTKVQPDDAVMKEASISPNQHFSEVLMTRVETVGKKELCQTQSWKLNTHRDLDKSSHRLVKTVGMAGPTGLSCLIFGGAECLYNGWSCEGSIIDTLASVPKDWRLDVEDYWDDRYLDYIDYPSQIEHMEDHGTANSQSDPLG